MVRLADLPEWEREHLLQLGALAVRSLFMCALKPWTGRPVGHGKEAKGAAVGLLVVTFVDVTTDSFIV